LVPFPHKETQLFLALVKHCPVNMVIKRHFKKQVSEVEALFVENLLKKFLDKKTNSNITHSPLSKG